MTMFSFLKKKSPSEIDVRPKDAAYVLYIKATVFSRNPKLYTDFKVPDTIDGRFDLLSLHISLILDRLEFCDDKERASATGQKLFDSFMQDMDQSLREKGVGDMGVPRRMRLMIESFNGRHARYRLIFTKFHEGKNEEALEELNTALAKNVYYQAETDIQDELSELAEYVLSFLHALKNLDNKLVLSGELAVDI